MKNLAKFIEEMPLEMFKKTFTFEAIDGGGYTYDPDLIHEKDSPATRYKYFEYLMTKVDVLKDWK